MRHQLPFDGTRAAARIVALAVAVALLVLLGALRDRGLPRAPRNGEAASRVARGTPAPELPVESTHR